MVAGHLQGKNSLFYIVLNYSDANGKRKTKWESTGLPVKGNKKRAELLLLEARKAFEPIPKISNADLLFADYMEQWLEIIKPSIELVTYSSYCNMVKSVVSPYFRARKIKLRELQAKDIQDFYVEQLKRVKATSVLHYHANIHKALKYAVKMDMIPTNPADKVDRPRKEKFIGNFYDGEEINQLIEVVKGTRLELAVLFGAFYGLRRSEIVGLKWDAIDFKNNNITIRHTVTSFNLDGKSVEFSKDRTKNVSSLRTLPLVPVFREKLLELKKQQEANRALFKRSYRTDFLDYIYVDEMGERIKPGYITTRFPIILEQNHMRIIRFHDLRHSCASLLLVAGVSMKAIQEWLGHSTFATTADIYAHLSFKSKITSANAMIQCLGMSTLEGKTPQTKEQASKSVETLQMPV